MGAKTSELVITKDNLLKSLDKALVDYQVAALTKKDNRKLYSYITNS